MLYVRGKKAAINHCITIKENVISVDSSKLAFKSALNSHIAMKYFFVVTANL